MWSGSIASIPSGWVLCNGQNGTPDLRDRFVIGAGGSYSPGSAGGSTTLSTSVSVNGHTLTVDEIPGHQHTFTTNPSYTGISASDSGHSHTISWPSSIYIGGPGVYGALYGGTQLSAFNPPGGTNTGFANVSIADPSHTHNGTTDSTGGGGAHNHTASATTTGIPPYYALAFIMKT
jgi:hypothetical protein